MKHSRKGEDLWQEWDGELFDPVDSGDVVFYTIGHVNLDVEVVRTALASALQRHGVVDSLGDGFRVINYGLVAFGHAGHEEGDTVLSVCDEDGDTFYGSKLVDVEPVTWVEVSANG